MKVVLSIILGLVLVTSTLVGIVYATPIMQPAQEFYGPYRCQILIPVNPTNTATGATYPGAVVISGTYYYVSYYYSSTPCFNGPGPYTGQPGNTRPGR